MRRWTIEVWEKDDLINQWLEQLHASSFKCHPPQHTRYTPAPTSLLLHYTPTSVSHFQDCSSLSHRYNYTNIVYRFRQKDLCLQPRDWCPDTASLWIKPHYCTDTPEADLCAVTPQVARYYLTLSAAWTSTAADQVKLAVPFCITARDLLLVMIEPLKSQDSSSKHIVWMWNVKCLLYCRRYRHGRELNGWWEISKLRQ